MRPQPLDAIRQIKPPSRCTDEEIIERLMRGELFREIKGVFKPSVAEVIMAGPRTKQEARTLINKYEKLRASGGGEVIVRANGANRLPHQEPAGVAPSPPETKTRTPDPVLGAEPVKAQSGHDGEGQDRTAGSNPATGAKTKTPWKEIIPRVIAFISEKSIALGVGGLGVWLAYIQLGINYEFWRSQGQSLGAKDQFGYIGIIVEVLLNALLPIRRILTGRKEWFWSHVVLIAVFFCWLASSYASLNFATRNIDAGAQRRADAAADIVKLQRERDDLARLQLIHLRDNRLNAARADGDQIQYRESQIQELQPKAGTATPDVYNTVGKVFYTCIPTLSGILIMIAFIGLSRKQK